MRTISQCFSPLFVFQYSVEDKRALFPLQLDLLFFSFNSSTYKVRAKKCIHVSNKVRFSSNFDCNVYGRTYSKSRQDDLKLLYTYRDLRAKKHRDKNSLFALETPADWSYHFFH